MGFESRSKYIQRKAGPSYIAENCFMFSANRYDRRLAEELVNGWMKSEGHRSNLLNPEFKQTRIGFVFTNGYVYPTQIFTA